MPERRRLSPSEPRWIPPDAKIRAIDPNEPYAPDMPQPKTEEFFRRADNVPHLLRELGLEGLADPGNFSVAGVTPFIPKDMTALRDLARAILRKHDFLGFDSEVQALGNIRREGAGNWQKLWDVPSDADKAVLDTYIQRKSLESRPLSLWDQVKQMVTDNMPPDQPSPPVPRRTLRVVK